MRLRAHQAHTHTNRLERRAVVAAAHSSCVRACRGHAVRGEGHTRAAELSYACIVSAWRVVGGAGVYIRRYRHNVRIRSILRYSAADTRAVKPSATCGRVPAKRQQVYCYLPTPASRISRYRQKVSLVSRIIRRQPRGDGWLRVCVCVRVIILYNYDC